MKRWRVWLPALGLLGLAVVQRLRVEAQGLSAWKGGGMGMYSEFHYQERELWLRLRGPKRDPETEYVGDAALASMRTSSFDAIRLPSEASLSVIADGAVADQVATPFALELWVWDWHEGELMRRRTEVVHVEE